MTTIGYRRKIKLIHKIEEPAKCVMNYDQIYIIQHFLSQVFENVASLKHNGRKLLRKLGSTDSEQEEVVGNNY